MILVVAAEAAECSGLLRRCQMVQPLALPLRFARMAEGGLGQLLLVADGPGPKLASAAAAAALAAAPHPVIAIVSIGLCGALDPALRVGDILVADELETAHGRYRLQVPERFGPAAVGGLLSLDRFLVSAEEKAQGHARQALGVEMEAGGLVQLAEARGLPLFAIKVVSDEAHENFAMDFNDYRDADGRFALRRIALAALARPFSALPAVIRMGRNSKLGSERLGAFLADCRI